MKQLVFVVDSLIITKYTTNLNSNQIKNHNNNLVNLYRLWNRMYIFSCKKAFSDSKLNNFQVKFIKSFKKFDLNINFIYYFRK